MSSVVVVLKELDSVLAGLVVYGRYSKVSATTDAIDKMAEPGANLESASSNTSVR